MLKKKQPVKTINGILKQMLIEGALRVMPEWQEVRSHIWKAACGKNGDSAGVLQRKAACIFLLYTDNRQGAAS